YRQKPDDPQSLIRHFGGIVKAGPVEPKLKRPKRTARDFRYPEDLGVFFHSWCAPRVELPEKLQKEIAEILAGGIFTAYEKALERWAKVGQMLGTEVTPPRCQAKVASTQGRRVFMMTRPEWEQLRAQEGKVVEIDLERASSSSLEESASMIAALAAECSVHVERIEVWPYNAKDRPTPYCNVHEYLVLQNLTRHLNLPMFAERASTQDSPRLRKHLRNHVFIVKERQDKGRWEPKARTLERIVFLSTR
ncbi:MAG: hypothetical protein ACRD1Q_02850, partial [Vicinamibacterales bacterium]